MEHDEELIENHVQQLDELKDVTEKQTTELKKGRKEFSNLNSKIDEISRRVGKVEEELTVKAITNGHTQEEVRTMRELTNDTNKDVVQIKEDVAYLRGAKEEKEKINKEEKENSNSNKAFYVQVVFICFALANFIYLILNEVLNWI